MYALKQISTGQTLAEWAAVPAAFACPLGEVNGAAVGWQSGDYEIVEVVSTPSPPTEAELYARAATRRSLIELGGITLNGMAVPTDQKTTSFLTAAYVKAQANPAYSIPKWKIGANTYAELTAAQVIAISDAVYDHIQACYSANDLVDAKIANGTYTTFEDIDQATEWVF